MATASSAPSDSCSITVPPLKPGMPSFFDFDHIFDISSHINMQPFTTQAITSFDIPSPLASLLDHIDTGMATGRGMAECCVLQGLVPPCPSPPSPTLTTPAQHTLTLLQQQQQQLLLLIQQQQEKEGEYNRSPPSKLLKYISASSSSEVNAPLWSSEISNLYTTAAVTSPSPPTPNNNNNNNNNNNKNKNKEKKKKQQQRRRKNEVRKATPLPLQNDVIHVRARRGQATDSHSLAERVRREKISKRMKFLQDLVPGCSEPIGKAMMLDEIINYVQSLQHQVEFLSMKLAAMSPSIRSDIESRSVTELLSSTTTTTTTTTNNQSNGEKLGMHVLANNTLFSFTTERERGLFNALCGATYQFAT